MWKAKANFLADT